MASCIPMAGKPKYVLVSGPRLSSKTVGCMHAIVAHAWEVPDASISVITPTVSIGDDEGCWTLLTKEVLPEWINGGFGMEWITEPRMKGSSKKLFCEIRNKYGLKSRIQLDSLKHEQDDEERFKSRKYSMIYASELSYYRHQKTWQTFIATLRGWPESVLTFLGDTNPSDEGEDSWIWKLWYEFRTRDNVPEKQKPLQRNLKLIEVFLKDNIFISPDRIAQQEAIYSHSPDLYARYVDGKWVAACEDGAFRTQFRPNYHIVGQMETAANPHPEELLPSPKASQLITGWDPGTVNFAFGLLSKENVAFIDSDKDGNVKIRESSVFFVHDEVIHIKNDTSIYDFIRDTMDSISFWEDHLQRPIEWRHWSDRQAFDARVPFTDVFFHQLVAQHTHGKIVLQAADKYPGSVRNRVELVQKLLFENRLFFNKPRCPNIIGAIQGLRLKAVGGIQRTPLLHPFDALSYALASECIDELRNTNFNLNTGTPTGGPQSMRM